MYRRLRIKRVSTLANSDNDGKLKKTLSWPHLIALGIGGIVGTGIYTLIGVGADRAGPAILLSFLVAGTVCACAGLAYAELASTIPYAGGAYTYSYTALGEIIAWIVGWSLILEYSLVLSTVAVGWSAYMTGILNGLGYHIPFYLRAGFDQIEPASFIDNVVYLLPHFYRDLFSTAGQTSINHGLINLPAILIVFAVAASLMIGTKESATVNIVLVIIKILALSLFVVIVLPHFRAENMHPFMPFGFSKSSYSDGIERGVMAAASIVFFAFYGFDTIATAAEEAKNPNRDLAIGILGSLIACIIIYILVGLAAVGTLQFNLFSQSGEPLALILRVLGNDKAATLIAVAAVVTLPTVLMAFFFGQARILFVMGRDGLLPQALAKVNSKSGTPVITTAITAILIAGIAGLFRLDEIAALANAGTLLAFTAAGICLVVMRLREPQLPRKFKAPAVWLVSIIAVAGCLYLFVNLPTKTQYYFLIWNIFGLIIYFFYGFWHSPLRKNAD